MINFLLFFLLGISSNVGVGLKPVPTDSLSESDSIECGYPKKNPAVALSLSLLPGGGQFYTENYLKGIVVGGAQLYFGGGTVYLHLQAQKAKNRGDAWEYEWYSNQRTEFLWWDALVWAFSMADAYVSAHFYKFKEQGKLKIEVGYRVPNTDHRIPSSHGWGIAVCLTK